MTSPTPCLPPPRPPAAYARRGWQVAQALLVFALLGWLAWRGAAAMEYRWQWYRVPPFFYSVTADGIRWGPLVYSLVETLRIAAVSTLLAMLIGGATAAARLSPSLAARWLAGGYLQAIRNTPLLVQLFLFYFVFGPIFGLDRFWCGVLCLACFEGSFVAEIIRGGVVGVARGQYEAGAALGLRGSGLYRRVILPQAMPLILPPLTGALVSLIKHSAIVSIIALTELTTAAQNLISDTFMAFEIWLIVAAMYLALTIPLSAAVGCFERRMARHGTTR